MKKPLRDRERTGEGKAATAIRSGAKGRVNQQETLKGNMRQRQRSGRRRHKFARIWPPARDDNENDHEDGEVRAAWWVFGHHSPADAREEGRAAAPPRVGG